MSADNKVVLVEVLQGTQAFTGGWNCSSDCASAASCGTTMDYAELTAKMAEELKNAYGDKVEIKYVNVDEVGLAGYPVMNQVLQMGYPYPITLINGQPKFAGGIMTPEVKQVIEDSLKEQSN